MSIQEENTIIIDLMKEKLISKIIKYIKRTNDEDILLNEDNRSFQGLCKNLIRSYIV